jgi:two-component sensor histidine kinase
VPPGNFYSIRDTTCWTEQGGPEVTAPQDLDGFGSDLVRLTIEGQLGGTVAYNWSKSGAVVTVKMSGKHLAD